MGGRLITRPELQGGFTVAGVEIVDSTGDIKAPISTTNITATGNTTIGDATTDTLTINAASVSNNVARIGTFSSASVVSGQTLSVASNTAQFRVYSDDGGVAISTTGSVPDVRGSLSRVLITKDNSANSGRIFGSMGQLKSYDGEWGNEQFGGVHGYLELVRNAGTINFQNYGVSAGVMATVETSGTMTLDTNAVIAGVASISKITSGLTQTGITAAFYAGIYNTSQWSDSTARSKWKYGLYVDEDSVDYCGIAVGKFVSAAAAGGGFAVTATNSAAMRVYSEVTADLTSAAMVRSILGRMLVTGNITSTAECFGSVGQLVIKNAKMQHDNAGVLGSLEVQTTAATFSGDIGDTCSAGVIGRVGVTVTSTTIEADGILAGIAAMSNITSGYVTVVSGGVLAAFYAGAFTSVAKQDWDYGLYLEASSVTHAIFAGTSANPIVNDTASTKFSQMYCDSGATSGIAVGDYVKLTCTGAGGGGVAFRPYCSVSDVAASNATAIQASVDFGTTGSITGSSAAVSGNLLIPGAMTFGTFSALVAEIYASATTSNLAGATNQGLIRMGVSGDGTGMALIDDTLNAFNFYGVAAGSGNMIDTDKTTHTKYGGLRVYIPGVGVKYLAIVSD